MKWGLSREYLVALAGDRRSALEIFKNEHPFVVTLDLGLPPQPGGVEEGLRTLDEILASDPLVKVIVITGRNEKEPALAAIERGAYDFLNKPVQLEELVVIIRRAQHVARLERECHELRALACSETFENMLGTSPQIQSVFEMIRKVATTDVPVLITGESGTGKELTARAIHRRSKRCAGPFVAINCGAIPENLLESELFGHEKGSFTGAHTQRKGRFEAAQGGTLFLDEIGELSLHLAVEASALFAGSADRTRGRAGDDLCGYTRFSRNKCRPDRTHAGRTISGGPLLPDWHCRHSHAASKGSRRRHFTPGQGLSAEIFGREQKTDDVVYASSVSCP